MRHVRLAGRAPALAAGLAAALLAALAAAPPAAAGAWEVYNNANALTTVAAIDSFVWAPSLKGLHRFDPATGRFQRLVRDNQGLRSDAVTAVARDAAGTLWFGSQGKGVSLLYPSGAWKAISVFDGLPSDSVTALVPFAGGMWVGTAQGLAFFVGAELQAIWPDGVNPSPFASPHVTALAVSGDRTWVGTQAGVYGTATGASWDTLAAGLSSPAMRSLAWDGAHLWAVTEDGAVWTGGESGAWTAAATPDPAFTVGAGAGQVFAGTATGVVERDTGAGAWTPLGGPDSASVQPGTHGATAWAGSAQGLWRYADGAWTNDRVPGAVNWWIQGMALQGSTVYMATRFGGVARYDDARGWRNFLSGAARDSSLISSDFIFAALVDREGYKWFGDWGGAISRLDDASEPPRFTHFFGDTVQWTYGWSSAQDPQGPVWFGLDTGCRGCGPGTEPQGLVRVDADGTRSNFLPTNAAMTSQQVRAIAFAPDGTMWVGYADFGVDLFRDRTMQTRLGHLSSAEGLIRDNTWGIVIRGSSAWVATDAGVSRFDLSGGVPTAAAEKIFISPVISQNGAVNPLAVDAGGGVWLGTASGLYHKPAGGAPEIFNVANSALVNNDVHSVVLDGTTGDLWIGTGDGVNRLHTGQLGTGAATASGGLRLTPNPARLGGGSVRFTVRLADGGLLVRTPVRVYDVSGRLATELRTDGQGTASWDGRARDGARLPAGVYFLRALAIDGRGRWATLSIGRLVILP